MSWNTNLQINNKAGIIEYRDVLFEADLTVNGTIYNPGGVPISFNETIEEVLTNGNDAGGLTIGNLGAIQVGDAVGFASIIPSDSSPQTLRIGGSGGTNISTDFQILGPNDELTMHLFNDETTKRVGINRVPVSKTLEVGGDALVTSDTESTSYTTGALVVDGGLGVAKSLFINGQIKSTNAIQSTSSVTGSINTLGGLGIGGNQFVGGSINVAGIANLNNTTDSTDSTDGGVVIDGGVGIAKKLNVAGVTKLTADIIASNPTSGGLIVTGGIGVGRNVHIGETLVVDGATSFMSNALIRNNSIEMTDGATFGLDPLNNVYVSLRLTDGITAGRAFKIYRSTSTAANNVFSFNTDVGGTDVQRVRIQADGRIDSMGAIATSLTTQSTTSSTGSIIAAGGIGAARNIVTDEGVFADHLVASNYINASTIRQASSGTINLYDDQIHTINIGLDNASSVINVFGGKTIFSPVDVSNGTFRTEAVCVTRINDSTTTVGTSTDMNKYVQGGISATNSAAGGAGNINWVSWIAYNGGAVIARARIAIDKAYFATAQHPVRVPINYDSSYYGLILSSDKSYMNKPTTTEAHVYASVCETEMDKNAYGIYSQYDFVIRNTENDDEDNQYSMYVPQKTVAYKIGYSASGGEGMVWACNINGNIDGGDYICSSKIPGLGMKQSDDLRHNYTIFKSAVDSDFTDYLYSYPQYVMDGEDRIWKNPEDHSEGFEYEIINDTIKVYSIVISNDKYEIKDGEEVILTYEYDFQTYHPDLVGQPYKAQLIGGTYQN